MQYFSVDHRCHPATVLEKVGSEMKKLKKTIDYLIHLVSFPKLFHGDYVTAG